MLQHYGLFNILKKELSYLLKKLKSLDFSGSAVDKNPPADAGDMASVSGPGRFHMSQSN